MIPKLLYIGFYDFPQKGSRRNLSIAACSKMDYTLNCLNKITDKIEVISPTVTKLGTQLFLGGVKRMDNQISIRFFFTLPCINKLLQFINRKFVNLQLLLYLLFKVSKDDIVLAYHSLAIINIILLAKRIRNFKLILEVNEIYSDVIESRSKFRKLEIDCIDTADGLIFPNNLMDSMFNGKHKPSIVEHGIYKPNRIITSKFDDGRIHVVYAGTFELKKGGVFTAIKSAEYLSSNYHLHILGFGTPEDTEKVKNEIKLISPKTNCLLSYEGLLTGDDYQRFLQKCHIGLSTQTPELKFNDTSFPSKILNYLSNGLQVVSIDIPAIKTSDLSSCIYLYKNNTPKSVAEAILKISDFSPKFSKLELLDMNFNASLSDFMRKIYSN